MSTKQMTNKQANDDFGPGCQIDQTSSRGEEKIGGGGGGRGGGVGGGRKWMEGGGSYNQIKHCDRV